MFINLAPYSRYGQNQTWEGSTPVHWKQATMRAVARERTVSGVPDEPLLSVSIKHGVTTQAALLSESSKRDGSNHDRSAYKLVEPGDIAYNKMRAWQGAAGISSSRGIVSPAYVVLRPNITIAHPLYLHYVLRLPEYASEAARWSYGITSDQWSLRPEHFRRIPVSIPPLDEQEAIVTYLAHAHQRINRAIATKRRLIALLEEARRVVLEKAFGDISARDHTRLKYVAAVQTGLTLGKDYGAAKTRAYPYLRVANVQAGSLAVDKVTEVQVPEAEAARCTLQKGDLLMTEGGDIDKLGRGTIWNGEIEDCLHQNHVFAVRCSEAIDPRFLEAFLRHSAARTYFFRTAKKTTNLAATNSTTLGNLVIPWFSRTEQTAVVDLVDSRAARVDQQIRAARREVQLLEEYRSRLTSDVVTGQLDVRAAAANLPEIDSGGVFATSSDGTSEDDEEALDSDEQGGA